MEKQRSESKDFTEPVFKRGNESRLTYSLKWAAWEWLYTVSRCRSIGLEVKLEGPGGRVVDLAAVGPGNSIYVVEVKASRADFSRDNHSLSDLEALKQLNEPLLRRGRLARHTLTQATNYAREAQPDNWKSEPSYQLALSDYERLRHEEQTYRERVSTFSIKFRDPRFLAIADYHYVMAPRGLVPVKQMPPQWGLLDQTPREIIPAVRKDVRKTPGVMSNVLRAIARSGTTSMMRSQGVLFTEDGAVFPRDVNPGA